MHYQYSIILTIGLVVTSVPQVSGNTMNIAAPGSVQAEEDTLRIDTVSSEAIFAGDGLAFYYDQVIILSNSKFQQKMIPAHISFGEDGTYLADPESLDHVPKSLLASGEPFAHSPSGMSLAPKAWIVYFTAPENGIRGKDKIFEVPFGKGQGTAITLDLTKTSMLPYCEGDDNYMHPAVQVDNKFMIFASDREGTMGGFDLFMSLNEANGWGSPVSLGSEVNSVKDEMYPFLDSENNLFFSSEGHSGFGGLDIYMCRYTGDGWERPINLMNVINGAGDDIGLKIDAQNNIGFYTSIDNRNGSEQIYRLISNEEGKLSGEILKMAINSFEEMFGMAFTSSTEQKIILPEVLGEAEKAVKEDKEVSPSDPTQQELRAVKTDPVIPEEQREEATKTEEITTQINEQVSPIRQEEPTIDKEKEQTEKKEEVQPTVIPDTQKVTEEDEVGDAVIFRVQITSSRNSVAGKKINISGRPYTVFEYLYKGAYRQTVGAFRDLAEAKSFQSECRSAGYSQAFVAAFINDERVTDPSVFR